MKNCLIIATTGLFFRLKRSKILLSLFKNVKVKKVAVIGDKTAQYCNELVLVSTFVPRDFSQEGFWTSLRIANNIYYCPQVKSTS